ncbi:MAG: TerC/Alx family metal homeostasis membrane protein [Lachnospiraceae bacterium]|nr:TerC/Alx family metal homeostasis membrane protein [Lachnospiraceae bacterium]
MWVGIALLVDLILFFTLGQDVALDFLGGYLIELSLSVDNLFVFLSIFTSFGVPEKLRHRVLRYGIIGAALLRMAFILLGAAVVSRFGWILYLFGGILIWNGIKMLREKKEEETDAKHNPGMRLVRKILPMAEEFCGPRFFIKREGKDGKQHLFATPLFAVLVVVELSDIIFAIDSVPAVFSVTTNPLIVYSSNLLAILGLRQMYFGLEGLAKRFVYVKYGIAAVLFFTGFKLLAELFHRSVSTGFSIAFIGSALLFSMLLSMKVTKNRSE